jgi:hypothetical protein
MNCVHCGLEDCEARFHECLMLDFSDGNYGAVHHLVVSTYMLQHNRYTDEAARDMLAFIAKQLESTPTEFDKEQIRSKTQGETRVIRRDPAPRLEVHWRLTINDVDTRSGDAYQRTARSWAKATLETIDTDEIFGGSNVG